MYFVSHKDLNLSPQVMKFQNVWWIYDLSHFHPYWIEKTKKNTDLFFGHSVWEALLKAYAITLFSEISNLRCFAFDYYENLKGKVSNSQIEKVFSHLNRLGIEKVGHLKRLNLNQLQKRFGKDWGTFFRGVLDGDHTTWGWTPHREMDFLQSSIEEDFCLNCAEQILELIMQKMQIWSDKRSFLCLDRIEIYLIAMDSSEDKEIELSFVNPPSLNNHLDWVRKLLKERLFQLDFHSPIQRLLLKATPGLAKKGVQLHLFENKAQTLKLTELDHNLKNQGFKLFKPRSLPSHLPEESWEIAELNQKPIKSNDSMKFRPLLQFTPTEIPAPHDSNLHFTERLTWIDTNGDQHCRNYYMLRRQGRWAWIFQNEKQYWFEQGVME